MITAKEVEERLLIHTVMHNDLAIVEALECFQFLIMFKVIDPGEIKIFEKCWWKMA